MKLYVESNADIPKLTLVGARSSCGRRAKSGEKEVTTKHKHETNRRNVGVDQESMGALIRLIVSGK